jgi:hypothetical protein
METELVAGNPYQRGQRFNGLKVVIWSLVSVVVPASVILAWYFFW